MTLTRPLLRFCALWTLALLVSPCALAQPATGFAIEFTATLADTAASPEALTVRLQSAEGCAIPDGCKLKARLLYITPGLGAESLIEFSEYTDIDFSTEENAFSFDWKVTRPGQDSAPVGWYRVELRPTERQPRRIKQELGESLLTLRAEADLRVGTAAEAVDRLRADLTSFGDAVDEFESHLRAVLSLYAAWLKDHGAAAFLEPFNATHRPAWMSLEQRAENAAQASMAPAAAGRLVKELLACIDEWNVIANDVHHNRNPRDLASLDRSAAFARLRVALLRQALLSLDAALLQPVEEQTALEGLDAAVIAKAQSLWRDLSASAPESVRNGWSRDIGDTDKPAKTFLESWDLASASLRDALELCAAALPGKLTAEQARSLAELRKSLQAAVR